MAEHHATQTDSDSLSDRSGRTGPVESAEQAVARLKKSQSANLLLVSDTHGRTAGLMMLLYQMKRMDRLNQPDLIVHLGDSQGDLTEIELESGYPILGVVGNCDGFSRAGQLPAERLLKVAGYRLYLTHGHREHVKQGLNEIIQKAISVPYQADLICFGHTHHQMVQSIRRDGRIVWLLNPGSAAAFANDASCLLIRLSPEKIEVQILPDRQKP